MFQNAEMITASSNAMQPTIKQGSLVFYREVPPENLQIGDIIAYTQGNEYTSIGRIVGVIYTDDGLAFRTKPDSSTWIDFTFTLESDLLGRVTSRVAYLGFLAGLMQGFGGKLLLVSPLVVMLVILFLLNRRELVTGK